jgi:hypothetical protein
MFRHAKAGIQGHMIQDKEVGIAMCHFVWASQRLYACLFIAAKAIFQLIWQLSPLGQSNVFLLFCIRLQVGFQPFLTQNNVILI